MREGEGEEGGGENIFVCRSSRVACKDELKGPRERRVSRLLRTLDRMESGEGSSLTLSSPDDSITFHM